MVAALADLDDALLAARWVRAINAADAALVAACEAEADDRGYTPLGLVAATTKETRGQHDFKVYTDQAVKDFQSGKTLHGKAPKKDDGKGKGKGTGYNPNRKGKGSGGGQFTTADDAQAKNAEVDSAKAATKAETDAKKELAAKKKAVAERRKAEDEAERRAQFDEEEADRRADADAKAATAARRESRAAQKAVEAAEDEDLATRIKANTDYEAARKGEVTLMTRQLAEARQLGNDADEIKLTNAIAEAKADIDKTKADRRALDAEKAEKTATRSQTRAQEAADEQKAATESSEQTRAREAAQRVARETSRRDKVTARTAEDADLQAQAEELDRRIEAARAREQAAAAAAREAAKIVKAAPKAATSTSAKSSSNTIPFNKAVMKSYENGVWRDANGKVVGYADSEDGPIRKKKAK